MANYKSLLILMIDKLVTTETEASHDLFGHWLEAFRSAGFDINTDEKGNDIIFQLRKPFSEQLEQAVSEYKGGGMIDGDAPIDFFLYPHLFESFQEAKYKPLTLSEWKNRMEEYRRFAKDNRTIQMITTNRNFYSLTVAPLLSVLNGDEYDNSFRPETIATIEHNLAVFISNFIDIHSSEQKHRKDKEILEEIREKIKIYPDCTKIVENINAALEINP